MSAFVVHLDESLLASTSEARIREWRSLASDLADGIHSLDGRTGALAVGYDGTRFTVRGDAGDVTIERADLAPSFVEYLEILHQLSGADSDGFSRVDALDMAKKVTHDRAGRLLKRALRPLGLDHEVARRVFSLLLALAHDTSSLRDAHAALRAPELV